MMGWRQRTKAVNDYARIVVVCGLLATIRRLSKKGAADGGG